MNQKGENLAAVVLVLLVIANVVGIAIPVWYHKEHEHMVNSTVEKSSCVVHVNIREGLWQRKCIERRVEDCMLDVQEWCDNLDFPVFNHFVISLEICGDLILIFALGTIINSKCKKKKFHLEMVGAEAASGGLLMVIGVLVYAAADTGVIGYQATDLHIGWAMCATAGVMAIVLCIFCMYRHINSTRRTEYFPIDDDDDDLIVIDDR